MKKKCLNQCGVIETVVIAVLFEKYKSYKETESVQEEDSEVWGGGERSDTVCDGYK